MAHINAQVKLLEPFYVMGDSNATAWLLNEDERSHLNERLRAKNPKDSAWTTPRRYAALCASLVAILVVNNLLWYIIMYRTTIDPRFMGDTGSARGHLTYCKILYPEVFLPSDSGAVLNEGEREEVSVPFEHDWTGLEKIEIDGYRYADINWKREQLFPRNAVVLSLVVRMLTFPTQVMVVSC